MLDDVAIYLVAAPLVFTVALIGLAGIWLSRHRVSPTRVSRRRRIDS